MKTKIISLAIISIIAISWMILVSTADAAICFKPNVPIPGMSGADFFGAPSCADGQGYEINEDSIGNYVNTLYNYAARLASVVAMFMIVFASWQWMMAAGNASKIDNAKETIQGALIGLALLFAGQLLLNNISSRLVNFRGLNIEPLDKIELPSNICGAVNTNFPDKFCGDVVEAGDIQCNITRPCENGKCLLYRTIEVDGQELPSPIDCPQLVNPELYPPEEGWMERCSCPLITITLPPSGG